MAGFDSTADIQRQRFAFCQLLVIADGIDQVAHGTLAFREKVGFALREPKSRLD
jgi:hypothetical protein